MIVIACLALLVLLVFLGGLLAFVVGGVLEPMCAVLN
jgi:hypothetical protein